MIDPNLTTRQHQHCHYRHHNMLMYQMDEMRRVAHSGPFLNRVGQMTCQSRSCRSRQLDCRAIMDASPTPREISAAIGNKEP
jgi:hypothetical protein